MIETADIVAVAEEYAASVPERLLALDDLEAIVLRINELYRTRGYIASRAYLPPQEIVDGIVRIAVVEGRLGAIVASSTASLRPQVIENHLRRLEEGQVVERAPIVRATLLLNDLPGIEATATLRAGALPGTTDLTVHVRDTDRFTGSLGVDNHGSRSSGAVRAVLNAQANNPLGYGDQLAVSFNSAGTGTRYARIAYEGPVNFNELRLRLAHAVNSYRLGEEFAALESTGESSTWSAAARYRWLPHGVAQRNSPARIGPKPPEGPDRRGPLKRSLHFRRDRFRHLRPNLARPPHAAGVLPGGARGPFDV